MLMEQSPQLALAQAKTCRQFVYACVLTVQCPSGDQSRARETVFEVPRHEANSGALSGRQRRHGRKSASCAAAAEAKKRQFSNFAVRAGQTGRQ
jgi:hypothetical protein